MAEVDFTNLPEVQVWFEKHSVERRCVMTSRAALRALPKVNLTDAIHKQAYALSSMRAILSSAGRALERYGDTEKLEQAALSASRAAESIVSTARSGNMSAADAAVYSAFASAGSANSADSTKSAASATDCVDMAVFSMAGIFHADRDTARADRSAARAALSQDASLSQNVELKNEALMQRPIWGSVPVPEAVASSHDDFVEFLGSDPDWAFWRRWYAQMWDGAFRDWDLAIEVAKISDEVWEGKDALAKVAEAIRGIEARLALKSAISEFRASVETVGEDDARLHRGHNNPPELIDDPSLIARREIVWAAIDDLEREVEKETPDKGIVRRSIEMIANWIRDVLIYLGRKADFTIEQVIKWSVPLGGAYLVSNPAQLQKIIETGKAWLPFLN
jgi:hypothetical protein